MIDMDNYDPADAVDIDPDYEPDICPACDGSGEGQHEGTTCPKCKGEGVC